MNSHEFERRATFGFWIVDRTDTLTKYSSLEAVIVISHAPVEVYIVIGNGYFIKRMRMRPATDEAWQGARMNNYNGSN
jgi:hypothetical protein